MNTWWYIHTETLYQISCRWARDDISMWKLHFNFPADEHVMIFTYRNFISTFPADEHLMIYTYRSFISMFPQMNTWWHIHTPTLYQLFCIWTRDNIYMLQLYFNFSADEHVMIYTYRNFITTFLQMNTWLDIHSATLYQLSCRWTCDDIYILQLCINFPADEHVMIYTYGNFIWTFLQMNTWLYIHTATLYQLSCWWRPDDIYIPQLYMNFPPDEHLMIYTYFNFISTFLVINTWRIYTYRNFILTSLQMNTGWHIHTATLY